MKSAHAAISISVPGYLSQCLVGFLFQMQLDVFNFGSVMSFWIFLSHFPSFSYLLLLLILKELLVLQKNCSIVEMEEKETDVNKLNMQEKEYS